MGRRVADQRVPGEGRDPLLELIDHAQALAGSLEDALRFADRAPATAERIRDAAARIEGMRRLDLVVSELNTLAPEIDRFVADLGLLRPGLGRKLESDYTQFRAALARVRVGAS